MAERRPKLLLHVGAPKTGTTTLQMALDASRDRLLAKGIAYPDVELHTGTDPKPKHQWLPNLLLTEDLDSFARNVASVTARASAASALCVVLSSEGLYNHWFDFSASARRALQALTERFDVTVWVVLREPVAWAMSMYVQAVRNPPIAVAPVYSTAEPPEVIVDHPYFVTRLQYARFVEDAERLFGSGNVMAMRYESGDILEQARDLLGVDAATLASLDDKNKALSALGLDLMRRLNTLHVPWHERETIVSSILELDRILGATSEPVTPSAEFRKKVLAISRESEAYLRQRFGIGWYEDR